VCNIRNVYMCARGRIQERGREDGKASSIGNGGTLPAVKTIGIGECGELWG
jgi:hypothetical protein